MAGLMGKEMGKAELGSAAGPIRVQPDWNRCLVMCLEHGVLEIAIWYCRSEVPFRKVELKAITATI